jgi:hypothetical protein
MQKQASGESHIISKPTHTQAPIMIRPLWFQSCGFRCALIVVLVAIAFTSYVSSSRKAYANPKWEEITTGYASLATDPNGITVVASTKTTMINSMIQASVLSGSCTGRVVFALSGSESDGSGNSYQQIWFNYPGSNGQANTIASSWYVNFVDPQMVDPSVQAPKSLGCAQVQVASSNTWATAFFQNNTVNL